jgi:hypothetical protein
VTGLRVRVALAAGVIGVLAAVAPLAGARAADRVRPPVPVRNGRPGICVGLADPPGIGVCLPAQVVPGPPGS